MRINERITAPEVRLIGADGENIGVVSREDAIKRSKEAGLDLIEVTAKANPPVARIMDYGKFTYELKKKARDAKQKAHVTETKVVQVKVGTGEHDKELKAKRVEEWLGEGHRVKVDLFLFGRYKYMDFNFQKERLEKFLEMISESFKIADPIAKGPKGLTCTIERDKSKKKDA